MVGLLPLLLLPLPLLLPLRRLGSMMFSTVKFVSSLAAFGVGSVVELLGCSSSEFLTTLFKLVCRLPSSASASASSSVISSAPYTGG